MPDLFEQYQQDFRDRCDAKIAERHELEELRAARQAADRDAANSLARAAATAAQLAGPQ